MPSCASQAHESAAAMSRAPGVTVYVTTRHYKGHERAMLERSMQISLLDAAAVLSDTELLATVKRLAAQERQATAQLVAHLAEVDVRRLYLGEGCSSLFTYCTEVLHLSEHAAYGRIEAARAARKFPAILEAVARGALHLTAVGLIARHLAPENVDRVIAAATHKTKREVEELVAALRPQPPVPASVRQLPQPTPRASHLAEAGRSADLPSGQREALAPRISDAILVAPGGTGSQALVPRSAITPRAPEQYLVRFTASRATYEKLR